MDEKPDDAGDFKHGVLRDSGKMGDKKGDKKGIRRLLDWLFLCSGLYLTGLSVGYIFDIDVIVKTMSLAPLDTTPSLLVWAYDIVAFLVTHPFIGFSIGFVVSWAYLKKINPLGLYEKIIKWAR